MAEAQIIYTVGGTVQAGGGVYIKRQADDELLELCRRGEYAFILSSRQVGKSSLIVRTARQLEEEAIRSVSIDLSAIGVVVKPDEWYLGILSEIANSLFLETDIFAWWKKYEALGPSQRLVNFCRDVLLTEISSPVVIFFDEIDSTISIPFADDFFIALRAMYNARSNTADFNRLSFVLIGVATPSDLISDSKRTPFNIGQRVELSDFSLTEAMPLAAGLGENAAQALGWVLEWTGGHPYLTQRVCAYLAKNGGAGSAQQVEEAVVKLFESEQGRHDNNLEFVRDMITRRSAESIQILKIYGAIRAGKSVPDDERSLAKSHLKISGLVRSQNGQLVVRNRIYERAFDPKWVRANTPVNRSRRIAIYASLVAVVALIIAGYFIYQSLTESVDVKAARFTDQWVKAATPEEQLANLAGLIQLGGVYVGDAQSLFTNLEISQRKGLFKPSGNPKVQANQVTVARAVYEDLNNNEKDNATLLAIGTAVKESDPKLAKEIDFWLAGRAAYNAGQYSQAETSFNAAIQLNPQNAGLYYDRAQNYNHLKAYAQALDDFNKTIELDSTRRSDVSTYLFSGSVIAKNPLSDYLNANKRLYQNLASIGPSLERMIYDAKNGSTLPGVLVRKEGDPPTGDSDADTTYDSLGIIQEFFWSVYGRNSIDNKGMKLVATVHYQKDYTNGFWNSSQIVLGDGDISQPANQRLFNSFATLDTISVEYMRGLIASEANLTYAYESGALSTSFAEVFCALIKQYHNQQSADQADWIINGSVFTANVKGVGLRSLKAPGTAYDDPVLGKDPQPATMKDYVQTTQDNGGVHINSGIPNRAFYLTAMEMGGFAWEKAGKIWYVTLTDYLKADATFQDAADQTYFVAGKLYGPGSREQEAVRKGWEGVGIRILRK